MIYNLLTRYSLLVLALVITNLAPISLLLAAETATKINEQNNKPINKLINWPTDWQRLGLEGEVKAIETTILKEKPSAENQAKNHIKNKRKQTNPIKGPELLSLNSFNQTARHYLDTIVLGPLFYSSTRHIHSFNNKGNLTETKLFDEDENRLATVTYYYKNDQLAEIHSYEDYIDLPSIIHLFYNDSGQIIRTTREYSLDRKFALKKNGDVITTHFSYDKKGRLKAITTQEFSDKPSSNITYTYPNNKKIIVSQSAYNGSGHPLQLEIVYLLDKQGYLKEQTLINMEAANKKALTSLLQFTRNTKGLATLVKTYNDKKTLLSESKITYTYDSYQNWQIMEVLTKEEPPLLIKRTINYYKENKTEK